MTLEIALVLLLTAAAAVLFVTEWLRMDVVALGVLGVLAATGLLQPAEALAGFSNPAVVTVWAMFILSAGLTQTGVAEVLGRRILGWVGRGETRMIVVIMLTSGILSAFMNNIGVAALLLPVVLQVARRTGCPPSRLLMPLAYGSLLGGLTTLVGTPPNLLIADYLRSTGREPFGMFDFTPVGGAVMLGGTAFIALVGRRWLPRRDPARETRDPVDLRRAYALDERVVAMRVPAGSVLVGRTLRESRLGSAAGLNVYAIVGDGETELAPGPGARLRAGDRLLMTGRLERLEELRGWRGLVVEEQDLPPERLVSDEVGLAEVSIGEASPLAGQSLGQVAFRRRFGVIVLAVRRGDEVLQSELADRPMRAGDRLLVQGRRDRLEELRREGGLQPPPEAEGDLQERFGLRDRLFTVRVPTGSRLVGSSLVESRLGDALGLGVLGLMRSGKTVLMPEPDERLQPADCLLVRGRPEDLDGLRGLQQLDILEERQRTEELETESVGLIEAMLAPRSAVAGRTPREIDFRDRYGLRVMAVLRGGRAIRSNLRDVALGLGDGLLLMGGREQAERLARDPDFLVLTGLEPAAVRTRRAPVAAALMIGMLALVLLGVLPISIAAVMAATGMVITGCLTMPEAYRAIEWRAVFLIAGMLPLGTALETTGAARWIADGLLAAVQPFGPWGVLLALYGVTAVATSIIPTAALVVLMAPIVLRASTEAGVSLEALLMAVAIAASASFTSPISHPANILVMGPGGYRFVDYVKLGVPLTLVVLLVALLFLPFFWPLVP